MSTRLKSFFRLEPLILSGIFFGILVYFDKTSLSIFLWPSVWLLFAIAAIYPGFAWARTKSKPSLHQISRRLLIVGLLCGCVGSVMMLLAYPNNPRVFGEGAALACAGPALGFLFSGMLHVWIATSEPDQWKNLGPGLILAGALCWVLCYIHAIGNLWTIERFSEEILRGTIFLAIGLTLGLCACAGHAIATRKAD